MNGKTEELGVKQDIGRLEGKMEMMILLQNDANRKMDAQGQTIASLTSDLKEAQKEISSMKPHVEDYKSTKQRATGLMAGMALLGGAIGGGVIKIASAFAAVIGGGH